ncbi:MAG: TatD family hydrolase [candidate division KSB1 bacterium]|nr:TatD family hydrolase [candidate division KSB1 bacterium]
MLIDTHAHLDFPDYDQDRDAVIQRAREAGVERILTVGVNLESSRASVRLAERYENLYAAVGCHPHDAQEMTEKKLQELREMSRHPKVVAIGEMGLDFYRNLSPAEVQKRVFRDQLTLAQEVGLPVIIHTRNAEGEILQILSQWPSGSLKGVFHCFPGDESMAQQVMALGFYISFTGTVTFKKSRSAEIVKSIPLERLLLETDCPFMAPVPYRGQRNEPAYIRYIAERMAQIKDCPVTEVAEKTTQNARSLFRLDDASNCSGR